MYNRRNWGLDVLSAGLIVFLIASMALIVLSNNNLPASCEKKVKETKSFNSPSVNKLIGDLMTNDWYK